MAITKDDARKKIERAMEQNGGFTHNLIGMALSMIGDNKKANELIDEYSLDELYGIEKEPEREGAE